MQKEDCFMRKSLGFSFITLATLASLAIIGCSNPAGDSGGAGEVSEQSKRQFYPPHENHERGLYNLKFPVFSFG
jgi:hypothetical protein